jgi:hypothetical protein
VVTPERFAHVVILLSAFVFTSIMFCQFAYHFYHSFRVPKRAKGHFLSYATFYVCVFAIMLPITYLFYYNLVT